MAYANGASFRRAREDRLRAQGLEFADEARPGSTPFGREAFDAIESPPLLSAYRRADLVLGGEHLAEERLASVAHGFLGVEGVGRQQSALGCAALSVRYLHHDGLFLPA
jgi:hypothetical protein